MEPLLVDTEEKRYTLFPIPANQQGIYEYYKLHRSTFWSTEEVDMKGDREDFQKLSKEEQHFLSMTLAFFSSSDVIVADNLACNFTDECVWSMVKLFYGFQKMIEDIHSEVYSTLVETLILDPAVKAKLFNAINEIPCVAKKAGWILQYMDRETVPFAERLVSFALFEGVAFSSSFASIFWVRERHPGLLKGLIFSNELISRDESLHAEFAEYLFNNFVVYKPTTKRMHEIVESLLSVERDFVTKALPTSLIGLSPASMVAYVEFTADQMLDRMGYPPLYKHRTCPLQFMVPINTQMKANFFEHKSASYARSDVMTHEFDLTDDF
jgi:ribonucleoside-diphosphate reductase beta chain